MLNASEALGGVVVLVVDVKVIVANCLACLFAQQIIVDEGLGGLAGKLHHHACWRLGIHVGILARDIVVLGIDNLEEHVAGLGFSGHTALVAIVDIALCYFLAWAFHQLKLHHVLNAFNAHLFLSASANVVGNALYQRFVVASLGGEHCFANRCFNLFFVVSNNASITFYYCLYHRFVLERLYNKL